MSALSGSISRRYARALFQLGSDNGRFEAYGSELAEFAKLASGSADLGNALNNPVVKLSQKRAILEALLPRVGASAEVSRFILLLLDRGRLNELTVIASDYERMTDARLGRVRGHVTSATPLDAAAFEQVRTALEKRTGKQVILEAKVDPELLGGIVAQVGDLVLDGSVRSRLANLTRKLLN